MTSTTGALTFRTGNVFVGKDKEHMRITAEGNLGIGTDKPQATLDVAGTIRTQEGISFPDGTMLKSASNSPGSRTDANGDPLPALNVGDTGTQGYLPKWTETGGAGGLGDSSVFESGGLVGIGTTSPEWTFHIRTPDTTVFKMVTSGSVATGRAVFQMYRGISAAANGWDFGYNTDRSSERFIIRELTNGAAATRLAISKVTGHVGIGTTTPGRALDVSTPSGGGIRISNSGNLYFRNGANTEDVRAVGMDVNNNLLFGGVGTTSSLIFTTGTSSERMRIDSNGNIAIGNTAPSVSAQCFWFFTGRPINRRRV